MLRHLVVHLLKNITKIRYVYFLWSTRLILDKYIFKEVFKNQFLVLFVLLAIFSGQSIVRLISEASIGDIPPRLIFSFLVLSLPPVLIFLVPLTLYIAVILTLGRICSDSEMVVMRSVGLSPKRIMIITLVLSLFTSIAIGFIANTLIPEATKARENLELAVSHNPEFLPIDSGRFVSFGNFNIYVEDVQNAEQDDKNIRNIFVIENNPEQISITVSKKGTIKVDENGIRWLVLQDGRRYENAKDESIRRAHFNEFQAPVSGNVNDATKDDKTINEMSLKELLQSNLLTAQAEAQWRIASCLAVFVLTMIAVPLSMVNPRQGRFARLMPAIVIYIAYYMILMATHNLVRNGAMPLYPGMYAVPICFLLFVAIPLNMPKKQIHAEMGFLAMIEHILSFKWGKSSKDEHSDHADKSEPLNKSDKSDKSELLDKSDKSDKSDPTDQNKS